MKIKMFGNLLIFLACLMLSILPVVAADYDVTSVEVNGIDTNNPVYVERGDNVEIDIFLRGTGATRDVRVSAWVDGYEYGDLRDSTRLFEVENNITYHENLEITIPDDLEAGKTYELHIRIADSNDEFETSRELRVQESRHALKINRVYFRDAGNVEAGRPLFTTVRVENIGDKDEDDVEVRVSIPDLGVEAISYIDDLERDDSTSNDELYMRIPKNAEEGLYDIVVEVTYNNGHSFVSTTKQLFIQGVVSDDQIAGDGNIVVSVDSTSKSVEQGKAVVYRIELANLGTKAGVISASVVGSGNWASSRVDPSQITVQPDSVEELFVYLSVNDNAQVGMNAFAVELISGGKKVGELSLTADVVRGSGGAWDDVRKALVIGFVVLAIILILLGLIIAFRKVSEGGEGPEEPAGTTSQTYY